jgi:hypothetical protein
VSTHSDPTTSATGSRLGGGYVLQDTTRYRGLGARLAALSGAGSVVAALVGLSVAETDSLGLAPDTPAGTLVKAYTGHGAELRAGALLCVLAAVLALVFAGPLWMRFKVAGEWQAMVAVTGTVALSLGWLASAAQQVAFWTFAEFDNGEAARILLITGWDNWRYLCFGFLVLAIAAGLAGLPVWLRIISVFVAAIQVIAMVPGTDAWAPAMTGFAYGVTVSLFVTLSASGSRSHAAT